MNRALLAAGASLAVLLLGGGAIYVAVRTKKPLPIAPGDRVLLLGDSIGVGMAQHLADALGVSIDAEPHVGWTAKKVRAQLEADESLVGDIVVVSLGTNDAALNDPGVEADDVASIVAIVTERGARRVLWVLGPNYGTVPPLPATKAKQQAFLDLVTATGVEILMPSDAIVAKIGADGLHVPPSGYALLASDVAAALRAA